MLRFYVIITQYLQTLWKKDLFQFLNTVKFAHFNFSTSSFKILSSTPFHIFTTLPPETAINVGTDCIPYSKAAAWFSSTSIFTKRIVDDFVSFRKKYEEDEEEEDEEEEEDAIEEKIGEIVLQGPHQEAVK